VLARFWFGCHEADGAPVDGELTAVGERDLVDVAA
jgi:hypothetical protein